MKKKVTLVLLCALLISCAAFFTACGKTAHTHSFTNYVSDDNATCTEDGTKTAKCNDCDQTDTIPDPGSARGHDYVDGVCTVCGDGLSDAMEYYIYYETDGGTHSNPDTYTTGGEIVLTEAQKDGYVFIGWFLDYDFNEKIEIIRDITGDLVLYAQFELQIYTATFIADGSVVDKVGFTIEDYSIFEPDVPEKTGYMGKWEDYTLAARDITINAVYTKCYTLTFDYNGATGGDEITKKFVACGVAIGELPSPVKEDDNYDYMFIGWKVDSVMITEDTIWEKESDATATASWEKASKGLEYKLDVEITSEYTHHFYNVLKGDCTDTDVIIPSVYNNLPVRYIDSKAFQNYSDMTSIVIPDSVTGIRSDAFDGCINLTNIIIPDGVISIGGDAFNNCSSLTNITIPASTTFFGGMAFNGCNNLTRVNYLGTIDQWAEINFYAYSSDSSPTSNPLSRSNNLYIDNELVTEVNLTTATKISDLAFYGYAHLTNVTIPTSVTDIGMNAFYGCEKLVEVINKSNLDITAGSADYGYVAYYAKKVKNNETSDIVNKDGYLFYTYENTDYLIGYTGSDTELSLPSDYNGNNYKIYKYAFYKCNRLTSVIISDGVTSIGDYAFKYCSGLVSVTLGSSVTDISGESFAICYKLIEVINNSSLDITTENGSYYGQVSTYALNVKKDGTSDIVNKNGYLFYTHEKTNYLLGYTGTETALTLPDDYNGASYEILPYAFRNGSMTSVTIGSNVAAIGEHAFDGCGFLQYNKYDNAYYLGTDTNKYYALIKTTKGITSCKVNNNCKMIITSAFYNCEKLTSVTIPNSVVSIGERVFSYCVNLENVTLPDNITVIPAYTFNGCSNLRSITIPDSVISIGGAAFRDCESLESITFSDNLAIILNYAFSGCSNLKSITIPKNVTYIGNGAFYGCDGLINITIGSGVTAIPAYAFAYCSNLRNITIPNSVTSIGERAFDNSGLTSVTISDHVTSIGKYAFSGCLFTSITIPSSVTSIGDYAFNSSKLVEVINNSRLNITKGSSDYGNVARIALNVKRGGTSDIVNKDGYLFYTYENATYLLGYAGTETELTLPDDYNGASYEIYTCAFENCNNLISVIIPDCVTSIPNYAFRGCVNLRSITIGSGVTRIGNEAFRNCDNLVEVINNSSLNITKGVSWENGGIAYKALIVKKGGTSDFANKNGYLFYTYENVNYLLGYTGSDTELILPNDYNGNSYEIYKNAFENSNLTSITMSNGVTAIGDYAFADCKRLRNINFTGTIAEWKAIRRGSWCYSGVSSDCVVRCTDGDRSLFDPFL